MVEVMPLGSGGQKRKGEGVEVGGVEVRRKVDDSSGGVSEIVRLSFGWIRARPKVSIR